MNDYSIDLTGNVIIFSPFSVVQFDFVYITGDIPAHDVWEITREEAVRQREKERGGGSIADKSNHNYR